MLGVGSPPLPRSRRVFAPVAAHRWPGTRTGVFGALAAWESTARHTAPASVSRVSPRSPPFRQGRRPHLHTHGRRCDLRVGCRWWHFHPPAFEVCVLTFRCHASPARDRWLPPLALHPARRHPRRRRGPRLLRGCCSLRSCVAQRVCCCCSRSLPGVGVALVTAVVSWNTLLRGEVALGVVNHVRRSGGSGRPWVSTKM